MEESLYHDKHKLTPIIQGIRAYVRLQRSAGPYRAQMVL